MTQPDPLAGLREQLRAVSEATERLVRDVAEQHPPAAAPRPGAAPPDAGWEPTPPAAGVAPELEALTRLLGLLRELLPTELHQQVNDLVRELLVLLRALIDLAVTALEQQPGRASTAEVKVEDIPIG